MKLIFQLLKWRSYLKLLIKLLCLKETLYQIIAVRAQIPKSNDFIQTLKHFLAGETPLRLFSWEVRRISSWPRIEWRHDFYAPILSNILCNTLEIMWLLCILKVSEIKVALMWSLFSFVCATFSFYLEKRLSKIINHHTIIFRNL